MLDLAIEVAKANPIEKLPQMAAIIAKRRKVMGVGLNSRKSHPMMFRFSKTELKICAHAEISAINQALRNYDEEELRGAKIFVARVLKNGLPAMAKPCIHCQSAIENFGLITEWTKDN